MPHGDGHRNFYTCLLWRAAAQALFHACGYSARSAGSGASRSASKRPERRPKHLFHRQRTFRLPNSCRGTGNRRKANLVGRSFSPAFDRGISCFRHRGNHGVGRTLTIEHHEKRRQHCRKIKDAALAAFASLAPRVHGRPEETMDHVLNLAFSGNDSEALIVALKDLVAISNGSACTSARYTPSHVIKAMG
jgi:hypothetical protein